MASKSRGAIVGLGVTQMGRIYGRRSVNFAAEAIALALDDAGLRKSEVDGLLINANIPNDMDPRAQMMLGLENLSLISVMNAYGSTMGSMMQYACMAIREGLANVVVLVYADAPLSPSRGAGQSYAGPHRFPLGGMTGLRAAYGNFGANPEYAMAARRHMHLYGTTEDHFGAIAIGQRQWAQMNPWAQMRKPMTMEDHHNARFIAEPLRLLDCCLVSNGAVAVVVTSPERARDLKQPPVHVLGYAQCAPGDNLRTDHHPAVETGAKQSGERAFRMAGITRDDIGSCQLYDCYTYTVLVTLEDYGFCKKGEGGPFVADGKLAPGGSLPTNTGGGQLSGYYMWAFTPLSEAVVQARGQGGERQVPKNDYILVSGNGGILNFHSTMIVSRHVS
ncbi:thiolase family protein [Rhodopila sp.]|jgi:acetyl-CoA acetyltransferase|uniref:thiolase family protein n=1 Tax=Rhodopila sp. TaxID=2480087 RepID=UPI002CBA8341|nr:thiolase family protein [Rhodopila sp.]HVZ06291.1 thiolase family protein [Rhodopila sp.]